MVKGDRLLELLRQKGISQAELARRVQISQKTINKLTLGLAYGSKHLHRIARELGTTPEYLTGEIDDAAEGAPPPPPEPRHQLFSLSVALPTERALAAAFEGLLVASRDMDERELARELAKRLPTLLRVAAEAPPMPGTIEDDELRELAEGLDSDQPARRRA